MTETSAHDSLDNKAAELLRLHRDPTLLTLVNVWDVISAKVVAETPGTAALVQAERQADAREELADMLADPRAYRGRRMTNSELGLPGCTTYVAVPRLGLLGRLASWWQVKVSSGCPLAWGP